MKKKILHLIIVFFSQMLSINAQCTWTGMVDNKWNNAGNWSCTHVPISTDNVIINDGTDRKSVV